MSRFVAVALFCIVCLSQGISGNLFGQDEDGGLLGGQLQDRPILKALLMKKLFGQSENAPNLPPLPLVRALTSGNTPLPIIRAMLSKQMSQNENANLLPKLLVFKHLAKTLGNRILQEMKEKADKQRVYTFTAPLICDCAMEYEDENGELKGFVFDLIQAVCKAAGKKCVVQYEPTERCLSHDGDHFLIGEGLVGRDYDVCLGWFKNKDREHIVQFGEPFWVIDNVYNLYVESGNPHDFNVYDISGKTVGFINGWTGGHTCLNDVHGSDNMAYRYVSDRNVLLDDLESGTVHAAFLQEGYSGPAVSRGMHKIGDSFTCADPGVTYGISRKDSNMQWFDETLKEMKQNGGYHRVCNQARIDHGAKGPVNCITK